MKIKASIIKEKISLMDYIAILRTEKEINIRKSMLKNKTKYITQEEYEDYLGYSKKDIENPELVQTIYDKIREAIKLNWNNPKEKTKDIVINNKDKKITIYGFRVQELKSLALPYVMKYDKSFRKKVKNKIKELSKAEKIDIEKYCFNIDTKDKFLEQDQMNNNINNLHKKYENWAKKHNKPLARRKKIYESCRDYIDYLKKYAKDNNIKKNKAQQTQATSPAKTTTKSEKEGKIQSLPINSSQPSCFQEKMSDDEIRQSRIKLGFISSDIKSTIYSLKKDQIIQDLPIYSKEESRFQGEMLDEEIKASQKKIGTYKK